MMRKNLIADVSSLGWRTKYLGSNLDNHNPAQTTLLVGEGGLSHVQYQGGATPRCFFPWALLLQPARPAVRHLNHAVGVG